MKEYKKYVLGGVFVCFMVVALMTPTEKSEAFWSFGKVKKENNASYTGAVANTESNKMKPAPSITVISPNGGEVLQGGKVYTIKWKTSGLNKKAPIQIKLDTITSSTTSEEMDIVQNTPNTGIYKWKVPLNISGVNIFKIIGLTGNIGGTDMSDGFFSIAQKGKTNALPKITRTFLKRTEGEGYLMVGDSVSLTAEAFDADNDDLVWSINWGDGSETASTCEANHKQNKKDWKFETAHIWEKEGSYTVGVSVSDCRGGTDKDATNINVIGA